jgi:hypothetical protein
MKLRDVKRLPIVNESGMPSKIEAHSLKQKSFINELAADLHQAGFPASFPLTIDANGHLIHARFVMDKKELNHETSWHSVTFTYEMDSNTHNAIGKLLRSVEHDEDAYAQISDDLMVDTIKVTAEFGKDFEKVWGTTR